MMQDKASITAQSRPEPYDLLFKVVTIGDSNSGKTSLIHRYINGMPLETDSNKPTVGIEFSSKNLVKEDAKTVRAQFWDTAGSERFQSVTSSYFRGSVAACVIYDVSDFKTFKSVAFWLKELKAKCNENIVIILIGNKCDLEGRRQVSKEAAAEYAAKH